MKEMKNNAPNLSEIKRENPFGTPAHYFDDFSARLQTRIEAEKQPLVARKPRIIQILKPALGLAASFALIFMLVYFPLKKFTPNEKLQIAVAPETDPGISNLLDQIDEISFVALLNDSDDDTADNDFTDDELATFVASNFSDYEIFENISNDN